jgi:type IV secretory pathway VirB10-like protein
MASGGCRAQSLMIATKRFTRHGLAISALGHVGILAAALFFARAASREAVPPDAIQVEIITPKEMPRYSGTPSTLRTSGTEQAAQSQALTAKSEQPPTNPSPPQPEDQHQAQRKAPAKPQEAQAVPPQAKEPPLPRADAAQLAMAQPDPAAEETPNTPDAAATAERLAALIGGWHGGGFALPPIDSPFVGYDFTEPFRELVSSCGALPPGSGISPNENISVRVRVFLNRDGTVAETPQLLESNPSPKQQVLMQSFVSALQKCQPYTMLPQDRYKQWRMLDLFVSSRSFLGQ